jgi:ornithine cyclodeaminase/alanine dehydrogenase-like protein (mu-crystallin family)
MSVLILGPNEVDDLITMDLAIEAVQAAFIGLASGHVHNNMRQREIVKKSVLNTMIASDQDTGYFGLKAYTTVLGHGHMVVLLFRIDNGELEAIIATPKLGATRTGAATGVATNWLSRPNSKVLTIIGAGRQAEAQVEAVLSVRDLQQIRVVDKNSTRMDTFAQRLKSKYSIDIVTHGDVSQAVQGADIIVTVTTSADPILKGEWLEKGTHVNAVGSNRPTARELDGQVLKLADRIVTDSIEQAHIESGDLLLAINEGCIEWDDVIELSEVVGKRIEGRKTSESITVYKSLGIAAEDICTAAAVLAEARKTGKGVEMEMLPPIK